MLDRRLLVECRVAALSLQGGKAASVRVVDVPGHPRVRSRFEQYADRACGVVFVMDAVDFLPHKTEVAEQLYEARLLAWWCVGTLCQHSYMFSSASLVSKQAGMYFA